MQTLHQPNQAEAKRPQQPIHLTAKAGPREWCENRAFYTSMHHCTKIPVMLKAIIKNLSPLLLIATLIGLTGCSTPEEKRAQQILSALEESRDGNNPEALSILEDLAARYPNDAEILQAMGRIYAEEGDHSMAAFFLEQAHLLNPDSIELLYQTYKSLEAAGLPSGPSLEQLAARSPDTMTDALWVELGQYRNANNQTEAALEAFLNGVNPDEEKPAPDTAATIGQLFAKLGNMAQAVNWLEIAADSDDPTALTALFGLLEIQLRGKQWPDAETTITRLNEQFPGAVEASQWKQASEELKRWRAAHEEMKATLAAAEAANKVAEEAAKQVAEAPEVSSEAPEGVTERATQGKAQVIADIEAAEAMANQPAQEFEPTEDLAETEAGEATSAEGRAISFDPNIAIEPADPDLSFSNELQNEEYAGETTDAVVASETVSAEANEPEAPGELPVVREAEQVQSLEELLAEAETAEIDRNYESAIQKYWAAIGIASERAEVWNRLSRAYLVDGQLQNAETAALETVRLAPREVAYTLDFLRVAQRSRRPEEFLKQLETAYDRFPSSPEITLSLARAHERISQDTFVARNLYLRFIDIAPNHPLVPEARDAVERL